MVKKSTSLVDSTSFQKVDCSSQSELKGEENALVEIALLHRLLCGHRDKH